MYSEDFLAMNIDNNHMIKKDFCRSGILSVCILDVPGKSLTQISSNIPLEIFSLTCLFQYIKILT